MRRDAGRVHPVQHTCDLKCGAKFQPAFAHTWSKLYQHQYSMQYQVSLNAAAGGWVRWWGHRRAEHGAVRPARITFGSLQAPMASSSTPVLLCLALCLAALHVVQCAIPAPCSACEAVAAELQRKLEAERPRNHLDMRHRLDKHGKRYGKVIPWRMSELRAVELLEDLCGDMDDYTLYSNTSDSSAEPEWVKFRGEGAVSERTWPPKEERDVLGKHLTAFCGMLLERHEEEVVEALQNDAFTTSAGVAPVLCQQISRRCEGKQYSSDSSEGSSEEGPTTTESRAATDEL